MANNYIYPHVNFTTNAEIRDYTREVPESNATTLLAPFTCDRGPSNRLIPIDKIADFEQLFGELDYTKADQRQIINIGNWLQSGGRVLACRIDPAYEETKEDYLVHGTAEADSSGNINFYFKKDPEKEIYTLQESSLVKESSDEYYYFSWDAKYSGEYYRDNFVKITFNFNTDKMLKDITLDISNRSASERFRNKKLSDLHIVESASQLISNIKFMKHPDSKQNHLHESDVEVDFEDAIFKTAKLQELQSINEVKADRESGKGGLWVAKTLETRESESDVNYSYLFFALRKILAQPIQTPFDVLIDCGYKKETKDDLIELFTNIKGNQYETRDDAFLVLSKYMISNRGTKLTDVSPVEIKRDEKNVNVAVYDQYEKIIDIYSASSGREIYVPTTTFLAKLLPYNDRIYGVQHPTAGLTRGVLKNVSWINEVPTNYEKNEHYLNNLNYIEKDSRGQYLMTELTYTNEDTALKFIHASRTLLKMKKDILKIARGYLFKVLDRITLTNLQNDLNSYLGNWIQNRALSYGLIELEDYSTNQSLTPEELLVRLHIKFTNTIEIISVEFNIR